MTTHDKYLAKLRHHEQQRDAMTRQQAQLRREGNSARADRLTVSIASQVRECEKYRAMLDAMERKEAA